MTAFSNSKAILNFCKPNLVIMDFNFTCFWNLSTFYLEFCIYVHERDWPLVCLSHIVLDRFDPRMKWGVFLLLKEGIYGYSDLVAKCLDAGFWKIVWDCVCVCMHVRNQKLLTDYKKFLFLFCWLETYSGFLFLLESILMSYIFSWNFCICRF